jgi:hypothetical protein
VTLRSQIHSAIDEVAPPAPELPREVVAFVLSDGRRQPRESVGDRRSWSWGMRQVGAMVAAILVIVLMVSLVVGGRLWRDWSTQQQSVAIQAKVAQLRDRPLNLPHVAPGATCPGSPFNLDQGIHPAGYGTGPVYAQGSGARYVTDKGTYFDSGFWLGTPVSGPVLIRARDLATNQSVIFGTSPYAGWDPATPSGRAVRTDTVIGQPVHFHEELVLDTTRLTAQHGGWETLQGLPKGSAGCLGFQADGWLPDGSPFTEIIVIRYDM